MRDLADLRANWANLLPALGAPVTRDLDVKEIQPLLADLDRKAARHG